MKRSIMMVLAIAASLSFAFSQEDNNNVFWTNIIQIKLDKRADFEKKLPAFLKTHYPGFSFRIYEIITGPNTGSYAVVTGPLSYKDLDQPMTSPKGEAARMADEQALDAISVKAEVSHLRRVNDLSMAKTDRKLKFLQVTYREFQNGSWGDTRDILKKLKDARIAGGSKVDVDIYRPVASGPLNMYASVRYFEKWEELDYEEKLTDLYDKVNGTGSWYREVNKLNEWTKNSRSELRVLRPDLSVTKQ